MSTNVVSSSASEDTEQVDNLIRLIESLPENLQLQTLSKIKEKFLKGESSENKNEKKEHNGSKDSELKQKEERNSINIQKQREENNVPYKQEVGKQVEMHMFAKDSDLCEIQSPTDRIGTFNKVAKPSKLLTKVFHPKSCYVKLERLSGDGCKIYSKEINSKLVQKSLKTKNTLIWNCEKNKNHYIVQKRSQALKKTCTSSSKPVLTTKDSLPATNTNTDEVSSAREDVQQQKRSQKRSRSVVACEICKRIFKCRSSLTIHMRVHTGERPYTCHICGKGFSQKNGLDCHLRRHEGKKPHKCTHCDYSSAVKIDIVRHMPIHTGEFNSICDICGKPFRDDCRVKEHIRQVHLREQKYMCDLCGFMTHTLHILKRHYLVKHTNLEKFECPICHAVVKQKGTFIVHLRRHTGERPYVCEQCGKAFRCSSYLHKHLKVHSEGEHECQTCGRKFKDKSHVQRHAVIHQGVKPFPCHLCSYSCNVKCNLLKHIRTVHKIKNYNMQSSVEKGENGSVNEDDEAVKRGQSVTEVFLQKFSEKTGVDCTVDKLLEKELSSQDSTETELTGINECVKRKNNKPLSRKLKGNSSILAASDIGHPSPSDITDNWSKERGVPPSENDILANAMKILTSLTNAVPQEKENQKVDSSTLGDSVGYPIVSYFESNGNNHHEPMISLQLAQTEPCSEDVTAFVIELQSEQNVYSN